MADDDTEEEFTFTPAEAGAGFKAEMWAMNFLLGYWPAIVGAVVIALVTIGIYGQYKNHVQHQQRAATAQIADVEASLPAELPQLPMLIEAGDEQASTDKLLAAATKLDAIAANTNGPAVAEAELKAAELFRLGGDVDKQRVALLAASAAAGSGPIWFSAESALANLDLEQDAGDAAVKRLKALSAASTGFLGQQATLDLGLALEHLERSAEAAQVYTEFLTKWPDSAQAEQVRSRQAKLTGNAG